MAYDVLRKCALLPLCLAFAWPPAPNAANSEPEAAEPPTARASPTGLDGGVEFTSVPAGAGVAIDGVERHTTPFGVARLAPGRHEARFVHGDRAMTTVFHAIAGATVRLIADFETGTVRNLWAEKALTRPLPPSADAVHIDTDDLAPSDIAAFRAEEARFQRLRDGPPPITGEPVRQVAELLIPVASDRPLVTIQQQLKSDDLSRSVYRLGLNIQAASAAIPNQPLTWQNLIWQLQLRNDQGPHTLQLQLTMDGDAERILTGKSFVRRIEQFDYDFDLTVSYSLSFDGKVLARAQKFLRSDEAFADVDGILRSKWFEEDVGTTSYELAGHLVDVVFNCYSPTAGVTSNLAVQDHSLRELNAYACIDVKVQ